MVKITETDTPGIFNIELSRIILSIYLKKYFIKIYN